MSHLALVALLLAGTSQALPTGKLDAATSCAVPVGLECAEWTHARPANLRADGSLQALAPRDVAYSPDGSSVVQLVRAGDHPEPTSLVTLLDAATGEVRWETAVEAGELFAAAFVSTSPATPDAVVLAGHTATYPYDSLLVGLSAATGEEGWRTVVAASADGDVDSFQTLASDGHGVLYAGGWAVEPCGEDEWGDPTYEYRWTAARVGSDGALHWLAQGPEGQDIAWWTPTSLAIDSTRGMLYLQAEGWDEDWTYVHGLNAATGAGVWSYPIAGVDDHFQGPADLALSSDGKHLYAFVPQEGGDEDHLTLVRWDVDVAAPSGFWFGVDRLHSAPAPLAAAADVEAGPGTWAFTAGFLDDDYGEPQRLVLTGYRDGALWWQREVAAGEIGYRSPDESARLEADPDGGLLWLVTDDGSATSEHERLALRAFDQATGQPVHETVVTGSSGGFGGPFAVAASPAGGQLAILAPDDRALGTPAPVFLRPDSQSGQGTLLAAYGTTLGLRVDACPAVPGNALPCLAAQPEAGACVSKKPGVADHDGDGIPALYAKTPGTSVQAGPGGLGKQPNAAPCPTAGDPDDDGARPPLRANGLPVPGDLPEPPGLA